MAGLNQFGSANPGNPEICARCEALLMDVLDRTASPEDQAFFDRHLAGCTGCSSMFVDAKRGETWLSMLKQPRPEPTSTLLERIIAQTSGAEVSGPRAIPRATVSAHELAFASSHNVTGGPKTIRTFGAELSNGITFPDPSVAAPYLISRPGSTVIPIRLRSAAHALSQRMLQPRLAMTAAMAFFSLALSLNLTGVHVTEIRLADLRPANIRRGFYQANANVVRYYDNLRVVYELEARVHEIQRSSDADTGGNSGAGNTTNPPAADGQPAATPSQKPQSGSGQPAEVKPRSKAGPGTSRREPLTPHSILVASLGKPNDTQCAIVSEQTIQPKGDLA